MASAEIGTIRRKHVRRPCLIVGSGPSARFVDKRAYSYLTIAVNAGILWVPDADYFCTTDYSTVECMYWLTVLEERCKALLLSESGFGNPKSRREISAERVIMVSRRGTRDERRITEDDKKVIFGESSAHIAYHLAVVMGCSPIFLVGCDCKYVDENEHAHDFAGHSRGGMTTGEKDWYIKAARIRGQNVSDDYKIPSYNGTIDGRLGAIYTEWMRIADANPDIRRRTWDASGGLLSTVFRSVDLESVLKQGGRAKC